MEINYYKPTTKKVKQVLLAVKGFGATLIAFFMGNGQHQAAAITGLAIGAIDMIMNVLSDGTGEVLKQNFEGDAK
jgi:hypothetical protein